MISVVITNYNEKLYIESAIRSVLEQTYISYIHEIVVVDDCSTDDSGKILSAYQRNYNNIEIVFHRENMGLSESRNSGIEKCTSEYVAFLDGDDVWMPEKIEKQIKVLQKNPDIGVLFSNFIALHGNKKIPSNIIPYTGQQKDLKRFFLLDGPIIPSTAIVKRDCFDICGMFDDYFEVAEDTDMWLRIASKYPILGMDECLILKREKAGSLGYDTKRKLHYMQKAVENAVEANPSLRRLKNKRMSKLYYSAGFKSLGIDKDRIFARLLFLKALKAYPIFPKALVYLMVSILPFSVKRSHIDRIKNCVKCRP